MTWQPARCLPGLALFDNIAALQPMGVGEKNKQFLIIITVANIIDTYGLNSRFIVKAEFEPLTKRSNWHLLRRAFTYRMCVL